MAYLVVPNNALFHKLTVTTSQQYFSWTCSQFFLHAYSLWAHRNNAYGHNLRAMTSTRMLSYTEFTQNSSSELIKCFAKCVTLRSKQNIWIPPQWWLKKLTIMVIGSASTNTPHAIAPVATNLPTVISIFSAYMKTLQMKSSESATVKIFLTTLHIPMLNFS